LQVFERHWKAASPYFQEAPKSMLELGPGDSIASCLIANAYGISSSILLDVGPFAEFSKAQWEELAKILLSQGKAVTPLEDCANMKEALHACNAQYCTDGLSSLRKIPSASIDWLFSQAVLEHVRLKDLDDVLQECRRVLKPGAISTHRIDLKDHLGGSLNNLRFSHKIWEHDAFAFRSGFYTNRVRAREWEERFKNAGFEIVALEAESWEDLPLQRHKLAAPFAKLDESELRVSGIDILLQVV
jgi:SAM-dependent methyltransferase